MRFILPRLRATGILLLSLLVLLPWTARAQPLALDALFPEYDAWRVATVLFDPQGSLAPEDVVRRSAEFRRLDGAAGNLGRRAGAAWVKIPVRVSAVGSGRWVLEVDYAPLDQVDVFVINGARIETQARLGDQIPMGERREPARSHIVSLDLPPGQERVLLLRVQTTGSMLVPLWLRTPYGYADSESTEQALQGLLAGMALCLMLYSLSQWWVLRDPIFVLYAVTLGGTGAFFAALSGFGPQHLWGGHTWLSLNGAPFFILVGVCGAFLFVLRALEVDKLNRRVARVMMLSGGLAGVTALAFAAGLVSYSVAQGVGMALGPLPLLLVLPIAFRRMREGDRAATYVLMGWSVYSVGVVGIVGLLFGLFPVNFWTMHAFQFASLLEMAMWMLVLGERVQAIRRGAVALVGERDRMRSLAYTDPLTGLLNRRGLQDALTPMLLGCSPDRAVAVFLVDLDGFKPVNDVHGHETGDALLSAVGQRLRSLTRPQDPLCRLGGDEFVFAVPELTGPADAERLGQQILQAFDQPFDVNGIRCQVGLTLGYAIAPQDDISAAGLLKRADKAMYAGKLAGKNCLRRDQARPELATA